MAPTFAQHAATGTPRREKSEWTAASFVRAFSAALVLVWCGCPRRSRPMSWDASGVLELPVSAVQSVHVARHSFSGGKALRWAAIGGLASAGALTAACQSVEGNEVGGCATAGLLVGGLIVGASALAVPSINASRWQSLYSPKPEALRPYARFPQGLPEGVDPFTLDPPPDEP